MNAQNDDEYFNPNDPALKKGVENISENSYVKNKSRFKYNLSLGTCVGGNLNGGSAINTYVSPSIIYPVNDRLSIEAGVMYNKGFYNNYNIYNFYGENQVVNKLNGSSDQLFFYAKGRYKLSENLTITGTAYRSSVLNNKTNVQSTKTNPNAFNIERKGYSLGFIYKMSEHTSLEFQMNYNKGALPYYYPLNNPTPFNENGMGLYSSPFGM